MGYTIATLELASSRKTQVYPAPQILAQFQPASLIIKHTLISKFSPMTAAMTAGSTAAAAGIRPSARINELHVT